jgi:hypothetical protein
MIGIAFLFIRHALVVDAGSAASRIFGYQWDETRTPPIITEIRSLDNPYESTVQIPLATAAREPQVISTVFSHLLEWAKLAIPQASHIHTNLSVLGSTAMRELDPSLQTRILTDIRTYVQSHSDFRTLPANFRVISPEEEAGYTWAAMSSVLTQLRSGTGASVVSIGSRDSHFAVELTSWPSAFNNWKYTLQYGQASFTLFVSLFHNLGIDSAIPIHVASLAKLAGNATVYSACFPRGWMSTIDHIAVTGTGDYDACYSSLGEILTKRDCGEGCLFEGVPRPPFRSIIGLSSLFRLRELLTFSEVTALSQYEARGRAICLMDQAAVDHRLCFEIAFAVNFLRRGLGVTDSTPIRIMSEFNGTRISSALGAILADVDPVIESTGGMPWWQVLIILVVTLAFLIVLLVLLVRCVKARRKEKHDAVKLGLVYSAWRDEDTLLDDDQNPADRPPEMRIGDQFVHVALEASTVLDRPGEREVPKQEEVPPADEPAKPEVEAPPEEKGHRRRKTGRRPGDGDEAGEKPQHKSSEPGPE